MYVHQSLHLEWLNSIGARMPTSAPSGGGWWLDNGSPKYAQQLSQYRRPGGTDKYFRPDGTSTYLRAS